MSATLRGATRRDALRGALALGLAASAGTAAAQGDGVGAGIEAVLGSGRPFSFDLLRELARNLARRPYSPPAKALPEPFGALSYEQYVGIFSAPGARLWEGEQRGFVIDPLHRGFVFTSPVTLHAVEDGEVRRIAYESGKFTYGNLPAPGPGLDLGFSGFRLLGDAQDGSPREIGLFQGASLFRTGARGQSLGTMARGLILRPGDIRGEELPAFRAWWIERPAPGADVIVLNALLDSESVAGAYRLTLRPRESVIVDVEASVFARVQLDHLGLAGMTTTYYFGPNSRRGIDDARPAAYEAAGMSVHNGAGEWLWRPLTNPEMLQVSSFLDRDPRGFGLLQRERDPDAFRDAGQAFERRPSLWVQPLGDWGEGAVQLFEIPTDNEINDNIIAYWRPQAPVPAGGSLAFAYRQAWCWAPPDHPVDAIVTATRTGRAPGAGRRRRYVVEFAPAGPVTLDGPLGATLTAGPGTVSPPRLLAREDGRVRVSFDLDPGSEPFAELRLLLTRGGRPASETWLSRWTP